MVDSSSYNPMGSSSNPADMLKDSPWGRLSEVTSLENVAQGFASATDGNGGGSPVGGGATSDAPYGGNPFANFGNPNAGGNVFTGGTNPWASLGNSGGGQTGGGAGNSGGGQTGGGAGGVGGDQTGSGAGGVDFASIFGGGNSSGGQTGGGAGGVDFASIFGGGNSSGGQTAGGVGGGQTGGGAGGVDFASIFGSGQTGGGQTAGGVGGGQTGSDAGGVDFASIFGGGSGGNVPQQSPFDTLVENLNNYFAPFQEGVTPDASQFGDPSKLNPFADAMGGSQSGNGSPVGGGSDSLTSGGAGGNGGGSYGAGGNGGDSLVADGAGSFGGGSYGDLPSGLQDVFAGLGSGDSQSSSDGFDPSQIPDFIKNNPQFGGGNQIGGNPSGDNSLFG